MKTATKQEMKREALKRMSALKLLDNVINEFDEDGTLYYSEMAGILYWVDNNPDFAKMVKDFEKKSGCLVYHCQLAYSGFGRLFSMLFVSKYKEDWSAETADLEEGIVFANVINLDDDNLSEMGSIGIKPMNGGIVRTA